MHMYINMYIIYIYICIYLFIYVCVYSPWGQLVNPQFSLPRPLFLMPSDPRRLEDIQQQPKAPRAHWMARRSICGQKPVGHHYYVCIYIYVSYSIYYIPMDPNTVWEGTWPQKIIPQVLPKEALSVHLVRPTQKTHLLFPADLSDDWKTWPASGTPILQTDLSGLGYLGLLNSIYRV